MGYVSGVWRIVLVGERQWGTFSMEWVPQCGQRSHGSLTQAYAWWAEVVRGIYHGQVGVQKSHRHPLHPNVSIRILSVAKTCPETSTLIPCHSRRGLRHSGALNLFRRGENTRKALLPRSDVQFRLDARCIALPNQLSHFPWQMIA